MTYADDRQAGDLIKAAAGEDIDDALSEVDELIERWQQRLTVHNLSLAKRYAEGALDIAWLWRRSVPDSVSEYLCAVFQREMSASGREEDWRKNDLLWFPRDVHAKSNADIGVCDTNGNEQGVLIQNVQLMEAPEIVYPSLVRFKSFDDADCVGVSPADFVQAEGLLTGTYWEVSFADGSFASLSILNHQGDGEQIERRSQIVDDVADKSAPARGIGSRTRMR